MTPHLFLFIMLALAMGFKHAYDADHILAVSSFVTRSRGMSEAAHMSLSWAAGHMSTAAGITVVYYLLTLQGLLSEGVLRSLEPAAGALLVAIGVGGIFFSLTRPVVHVHAHRHLKGMVHTHPHVHRIGHIGPLHRFVHRLHLHRPLLGIGALQGVLSNDELLVLLVAFLGVRSLLLLLGGVLIFTVGVMLGMLLFAVVINYSLSRLGADGVRRGAGLVAGSVSIAYGSVLLLGLGGLNLISPIY